MKKSDDAFPDNGDETLNVSSKNNEDGDVMKYQTSLKISDEKNDETFVHQSMTERRSVNSDRRISDGHNYIGAARRMNIDRRK